MGPTNYVLDGGGHWRDLSDTIERFVRGGDAALRQIYVTSCAHFPKPFNYSYRCACSVFL